VNYTAWNLNVNRLIVVVKVLVAAAKRLAVVVVLSSRNALIACLFKSK